MDAAADCAENHMIAIRLRKDQRAKAWRAMIEIAPVRLVAKIPSTRSLRLTWNY